MKTKSPLLLVVMIGSLLSISFAHAEDRRDDEHHGDRVVAPRPAPPKFAAHPPGQHPHGPMVRAHAVRVLQPRVIQYGGHEWTHWGHPEFARPSYYWDWNLVHNVSCTAEDSYGDQYPVTESAFRGFGLANMTTVEDDALDRCYSESGSDPSCYLLTCAHF